MLAWNQEGSALMETRERFALEIFKLLLEDPTVRQPYILGHATGSADDSVERTAVACADALLEALDEKNRALEAEARERLIALTTNPRQPSAAELGRWFAKRPPVIECTWEVVALPLDREQHEAYVATLLRVCSGLGIEPAMWIVAQLRAGEVFRVTASEAAALDAYGFIVRPVLKNMPG
jgi:hypothetical protein